MTDTANPSSPGSAPTSNLDDLARLVAAFIAAREWEQFHTPKNLAMSIGIEAAELMELFQWQTGEQGLADAKDPATRERISEEMADVFMYLLSLSNQLGIDLGDAVRDKLIKNEKKYPADACRGHWTVKRPSREKSGQEK